MHTNLEKRRRAKTSYIKERAERPPGDQIHRSPGSWAVRCARREPSDPNRVCLPRCYRRANNCRTGAKLRTRKSKHSDRRQRGRQERRRSPASTAAAGHGALCALHPVPARRPSSPSATPACSCLLLQLQSWTPTAGRSRIDERRRRRSFAPWTRGHAHEPCRVFRPGPGGRPFSCIGDELMIQSPICLL